MAQHTSQLLWTKKGTVVPKHRKCRCLPILSLLGCCREIQQGSGFLVITSFLDEAAAKVCRGGGRQSTKRQQGSLERRHQTDKTDCPLPLGTVAASGFSVSEEWALKD